ncbi:hypothetical protein ACFL6E_06300 [Candidatus Neomarinimicrobiota bacterium]
MPIEQDGKQIKISAPFGGAERSAFKQLLEGSALHSTIEGKLQILERTGITDGARTILIRENLPTMTTFDLVGFVKRKGYDEKSEVFSAAKLLQGINFCHDLARAGNKETAWRIHSENIVPALIKLSEFVPKIPLFRLLNENRRWQIKFMGGDAFQLADSDGLYYIHKLLAKPGEELSTGEMVQLRQKEKLSPFQIPDEMYSRLPKEKLLKEQSLEVTEDLKYKLVDENALADTKERLRVVLGDLSKAERDHDPGRIDTLKIEKGKLLAYLSNAFDPSGKDRGITKEAYNRYRNLQRAIVRAKNKIAQNDANLKAHFDNYIYVKVSMSIYLPDTPAEWDI